MVFFVAGVLSVIVMFPKRVAVLAMLYLSFGDPFASAVGIRLGYLGPKFSNGVYVHIINKTYKNWDLGPKFSHGM